MTIIREAFYKRDEVAHLADAYRHVFGPITPALREYWDLDRKREWGCLTTDFETATFEQYEEASRRSMEVEKTRADPVERGRALLKVTNDTGVGLSLGVCPWTDHGLYLTYEQNKHKSRATIILGHDWYPIVPLRSKKPHPVDVPLWRYDGLHGTRRYINIGAVPKAIYEKSELLVFLNLKPDFRPPNTPSTGNFNPYPRCVEGLDAVVDGIRRNYDVQLISYGAPVWELLRGRVEGLSKPLGILSHSASERGHGRPLELRTGIHTIRYLPLAHPCDRRNFNPGHARHAHEGFQELGLGGSASLATVG